ncbi:DUF2087 domain-containing protein [Halolamina salifodinae]|uniref:DUF2087 domain-containing protein n=1 Tax=Halolamina salifodinae TaxID=1202767 RepID=A0A8T4GY90_9EURY|nr:DUF2087 domain-containing protein [Halolamina salifodinae]MBP1987390.1 hypothetical protein [Halolamina salifodinae]
MALDFDRDREAFFEKCRESDSVPGNSALKLVVLEELLDREFETGETYTKTEVTERIGEHFAEPIHLRRELVNFGYVHYDNRANEYEILTRTLSEEDVRENGHLTRHAKDLGVLN